MASASEWDMFGSDEEEEVEEDYDESNDNKKEEIDGSINAIHKIDGRKDDDDNDDDDDDDDDEKKKKDAIIYGNNITNFLIQQFLKRDPKISLSNRHVGIQKQQRMTEPNDGEKARDDFDVSIAAIDKALKQRGIHTILNSDASQPLLDALIVIANSNTENLEIAHSHLVPGGFLIVNSKISENLKKDFVLSPESILSMPLQTTMTKTNKRNDNEEDTNNCLSMTAYMKMNIHVHTSRCRWLEKDDHPSIEVERKLLQQATRCLSVDEITNSKMTETSIQKSLQSLDQCGYCIIRGLLDPDRCQVWADAVLQSVHAAAKVLLEKDQVDIYRPHSSKFEPQAYQEMSMREDLRLDLRHGPELSKLRGKELEGNTSIEIKANTTSTDSFLRGHESLLRIIRLAMNPQHGDLYKGNLGRFNFGGSGADGSFQDVRLSKVGGIVSMPGSGDQAIHADTPHLFEHLHKLPPHYINMFAPATTFHDKVGGTAFIHGSHSLDFTARHCGSSDDYKSTFPYLVRPCLEIGDVVLFDCRVLHFGMSNDGDSAVERVMLYSNCTQAWFVDPKNWDEQRKIFEE